MIRITKVTILVLLFIFLGGGILAAEESPAAKTKLIFFYSNSCYECIKVKDEFFPKIYERFKDRIEEIEYRDIADIENYKLFLGLKEQYKISQDLKVPVIFFEGNFLSGRDAIIQRLEDLLENSLGKPGIKKEKTLSFNLLAHFSTFTLMAVTSAGLIDGINPCAFTVIVFFISFLLLQGYKKKELAIIGIFFILAVFLTYLLIGLGFFGFFYSLKGFWLVRRIFNFAIGILSIILGMLAVYDFFRYKKTGKTEGLVLQLPQVIKNRIHSLIGLHYRKSQDSKPQKKTVIFSLVLTAFITGFFVSILEAVCTGQVYLPTITFILKTTQIKLQALGYLLLYNLAFIIPLLVIFLFALLGVTSERFAQFLKRHFLITKLLLAVLFFSLGILLIWRG
jgi:cytochrome c biogenesis protein CcdA/glutaredoxin